MTLNVAHHEEVLIKILKALFEDEHISPYLAFKGGTAAMFFYQLDRFSVDLDFDLLDASKEKVVFTGVLEILKKNGTVKSSDNKRFGFTFILAYEGKFDQAQNLKVEISKRVFDSRYEIKEYMGIPMKVMVREDMVANKLIAMYARMGRANRDIYDVWFFLHHAWPINTNIITSRTGMAFDEFLKASITALERLDNKNILQGLGELLSAKQKSWVKAKLKTETLFLLSLKARRVPQATIT